MNNGKKRGGNIKSTSAKTLVFIGGPGSGKDTQIAFLKDQGYKVISTGSISREKEKNDPKLKELLASGNLVADETITEWFEEDLEKISLRDNLIINGYPRNISQADLLVDILNKNDRILDEVVYIRVPSEILQERLAVRSICSICGRNAYAIEGKCKVCGGEITKRSDDKESAVKRRIEVFLNETKHLRMYYTNKGNLLEIDGTKSIEEIATQIKRSL